MTEIGARPTAINFYSTGVGIKILVHGIWKMWVLFELKEIKYGNEHHFMENKMEIMHRVLKNALNFVFM
jgi:hypothetical protein